MELEDRLKGVTIITRPRSLSSGPEEKVVRLNLIQ